MKLGSLAEDVAPRTGKIIKNQLSVFETGENLLQSKGKPVFSEKG